MYISDDQKSRFHRDGFLILRHLFDAEETGYLLRAYLEDEAIQKRAVHLSDGRGGQTEIALWNEAGEDVFGAVARCARMVDTAEALIEDEVYHYHSKINVKRPEGGESGCGIKTMATGTATAACSPTCSRQPFPSLP